MMRSAEAEASGVSNELAWKEREGDLEESFELFKEDSSKRLDGRSRNMTKSVLEQEVFRYTLPCERFAEEITKRPGLEETIDKTGIQAFPLLPSKKGAFTLHL